MDREPKYRTTESFVFLFLFLLNLLFSSSIFFLREYFSFRSPGDSVVMGQPANAGHTGLIPGQGRSHMPWNWARVPQLLNLSSSARVLQQEALLQWEVWASQQKSSPCSPQLEKTCVQERSQHSHKQVNFSFFLSVRSLENRECFQLIADRATQVGQGFC